MNVRLWIAEQVRRVLEPYGEQVAGYAGLVRPATEERFGDYQINCAMPLAKLLRRNPREIAQQIAEQAALKPLAEHVSVAGPGFVNLRLGDAWITAYLQQLLDDDRLGVDPVAKPATFVIDFSSPNVAKPMHVGHLRSTIIGDALARLLRFCGHRVITDNHIGDWGTQFGMIIYGFKHYLDEQNWRKHPVQELARLYQLVHRLVAPADWEETLRQAEQASDEQTRREARRRLVELARQAGYEQAGERSMEELLQFLWERVREAKPIAEAARQETARLHQGDPENRRLWETFMPYCMEELHRIYRRLDVHFDHTLGESFYQPMLEDVVRDLLRRGIATESEGAVCVFFDEGEPPCIVRKSDGAYTYATTDLATIKYRIEQFQPDYILYVVDYRQSLHFKQLFEVARRWGFTQVRLEHVAFGTVLGKDRRPFRTREGGTVGLEALIDEAVRRARTVVDENSPHLPEDERQEIAEAVGIGALKYADLSQNRTSDYVFSWEKMLAMQGNTGTYLQYAYARIRSIFRKGEVEPAQLRATRPRILLSKSPERRLALALLRFPEAIEQAVEDYMPHYLTSYLYNLAETFSTFYNTCDVLRAESETLRLSRLALCELTARTLQRGLELLGIRTIERM